MADRELTPVASIRGGVHGCRQPPATRTRAFTWRTIEPLKERNLIFTSVRIHRALGPPSRIYERGGTAASISTCSRQCVTHETEPASQRGKPSLCAELLAGKGERTWKCPAKERGGAVRQQWNIIDKGSWCLWPSTMSPAWEIAASPARKRGKYNTNGTRY